jgi:hypothetical protein
MKALALLLKLKCYEVAQLQDRYSEDDAEHDQLVIESYLNPVTRVKGGKRYEGGSKKRANKQARHKSTR